MRDRTIIPTNLLDWPRCQSLLPDQRLILMWVWACPHISAAGCGFVPLKPAAATLGLDPGALAGGLEQLENAGLVALDQDTGEVFVLDWYRFHKFGRGPAAQAAAASIRKVQSERLKRLILEKSMGCFPTTTRTTTTTVSCKQETEPASPAGGADVRARKKSLMHGVLCWTPEDRQQVAGLVAAFGGDAVQAVAEGIRQNGAEPLPSLVSKSLKGKNHGNPGEHAECDSDALHAAISSSMQYYGVGEREIAGEVIG